MRTRRAQPGSEFHQERYCSSPEFERGLGANFVAKRCRVLDSPELRELLWFLQWKSHQPGGLSAVVNEMTTLWPSRFIPKCLKRLKAGDDPLNSLISEIGDWMAENAESSGAWTRAMQRHLAREAAAQAVAGFLFPEHRDDIEAGAYRGGIHELLSQAGRVSSNALETIGIEAAKGNVIGISSLADHLFKRVCLDPAFYPEDWAPWYLPELIQALLDYKLHHETQIKRRYVTTEIGQRMSEAFEFAAESRGLVLIEGIERRGKTHAAKAWCEARPGRARYIAIPSTGDDISFYRELCDGLGIGASNAAKAVQLRDKVQETVKDGDLLLVLDNAHYSLPQANYKGVIPRRMTWILTALVDKEVPVAFVATPQFTVSQQIAVKKSGWRAEQLTGRILDYVALPAELSDEDLRKVARSYIPDACAKSVELLISYATASDKYLQGIESLAKRALYIAKRAGRSTPTFEDLKVALQNGAIPSDLAIDAAIQSAKGRVADGRKRRRLQERVSTGEVLRVAATKPGGEEGPADLIEREIRPITPVTRRQASPLGVT